MNIIKLPPVLPGNLDLATINQQLHTRITQLDWSAVVSAPETQLAVLLQGLDANDELLGIDGAIADNIAADITRYFEKQKTTKKPRSSKKQVSKATPKWQQGTLLETKFIPSTNAVIEEKPATTDAQTSKNPQLQPPTDYEIRAKLEKAILNDLLGPAGGEEEELDEDNVSDRYLVGLLAPQQRRINLEQEDELAVAGIGTAEEGSTEVSVPPKETMFPSSFGMSFCVNATAKALQVTAGWGQYERTESQTLTKKDDTPKRVWKRRQIRETSPAIPLVEGEIAKWTVHSEFPQVFIQGRIRKQTNGDWIVSLFLVNGQKEPAKLRDEAWLFQPELSVQSADSQHPDIFLKRHQPRSADKLDPVVYKEEKMMAMLYRYKVEFAVGHGVSVHAQTAPSVTQRAVKLSTSVIPAYEVPKTSPPKVSEIPELAGLVLDMKELSQTQNADFSPKLNALVIAYASWIEDEEKRISDPNEGLADYQDAAKDAINNCKRALERIQQGLTLLQTDEKAAEAFRFMNQAMYLQRIHSIYSEKVRQSQEADLDKIDNPTWYPFQLAFILLNLPSVTDLHHPDRSHETEAIADLLWFPTGGGKTEAYLGLTAYTIGLRRLQGVVAGRSGEYGLAVLMRYTLRLLTLQQFQRATALICACESIRRENEAKWGQEPFRIGLWVGQRTTPNHTEQSEEFCKQARGQYQQSASGSPHQLTNCPWCGTKIDPGKHITVESVKNGRGRTLIYCGDSVGRCLFTEKHSKGEGLPILVFSRSI